MKAINARPQRRRHTAGRSSLRSLTPDTLLLHPRRWVGRGETVSSVAVSLRAMPMTPFVTTLEALERPPKHDALGPNPAEGTGSC
uniref:Uncharacterized protein n=1 Tax=Oryza punctata TaxID=4537 RepID=A0A0E0KQG3_ORYPU